MIGGQSQIGNYLRIRGEESDSKQPTIRLQELPPHTRRRVFLGRLLVLCIGTTSAYAEKSSDCMSHFSTSGNYLRIRGEESVRIEDSFSDKELPPHTRRRDISIRESYVFFGTTSAYAEKSS